MSEVRRAAGETFSAAKQNFLSLRIVRLHDVGRTANDDLQDLRRDNVRAQIQRRRGDALLRKRKLLDARESPDE